MHSNTLPPKIIIAILNWNSGKRTAESITALSILDYPNYEVVVVDNASFDDSIEVLRATHPNCKMIIAPRNLGFAGGNQLALKYAQESNADALWLLNSDQTLRANTLSELVKAYQTHGAGLYGSVSLQMTQDGKWVSELDILCYEAPGIVDFDHPLVSSGRTSGELMEFFGQSAPIVANLGGNSLFIPLIVAEQHGFMDEGFFMYGEDFEYCFRLAAAGIPSRFVLTSEVLHEGHGSWKERPKLVTFVIRYYYLRNRLIMLRRFGKSRVYFDRVRRDYRSLRAKTSLWIRAQLKLRRFQPVPPELRFEFLAFVHGLQGKLGKTFAPENYLN